MIIITMRAQCICTSTQVAKYLLYITARFHSRAAALGSALAAFVASVSIATFTSTASVLIVHTISLPTRMVLNGTVTQTPLIIVYW